MSDTLVSSNEIIESINAESPKIDAPDIETRHCTGTCGRTLPATSEFFYSNADKRSKTPTLRSKCKVCYNTHKRRTSDESVATKITEGDGLTKYCPGCERTLSLNTECYSHKRSGWERLCKACRRSQEKKRKQRRKIEKARGAADQCGSCGTDKGNILGDINDVTHKRYGYLCSRCYRMMLECQKDVPRMRKVLTYIELTR